MTDFLKRFLPSPVFEGNDGGAGGGGDGGAGDGDGGANTGDGGAGGEGWRAPDGIPQEFIGADAEETLGRFRDGYNDLSNRFNGMREKLAKAPAAPKTAEEYAFDPGESLSPYFGDLSEDKLYGSARLAAHKHGLSQEQFSGFLADTFGPMAEAGLLSQPFDANAELKQFQEATGLDRAGVSKALQQTETFAKGLVEQLDLPDNLSDAAKGMFMGLTDTAAGNAILQALSARMNDSGFGLDGRGEGGDALTKEDLDKMTADPRIDPANREHKDPKMRYDPALRKRYDDGFRKHYPS